MSDAVVAPTVGELRARLGGLTIADEARLGKRLRSTSRPKDLAAIARQISAGELVIANRTAAVPDIAYPDLPVTAMRGELAEAIRDNQVVIVAGETGSGKTTQLPKICLELGRGIRGTIGHTQPRRLAARTVAQRIADELHTPLGDAVGYAVRFTDQVSDRTLIKLMTDGILLAEIQRDRLLRRYDTLILDEAHERSLNIDFLLGYLTDLLPRRPDLKLIVTSATIDPQRFAAHFGGAPIVEVSGRTYPVEIRYRPLEPEAISDQTDAIVAAVHELDGESPGDVLVFLSGEREIRDTADALRGEKLRNTEVLPLYARLPTAEQHKVFEPHTGRRIVLATNVAETSLTVPGIRYVIDPGTARISRYSRRTKVQRLPIEPISQASAGQRAGRCGRLSDGICIRLYSEPDFESRPRFTEPEILRTNLASVLLQMAALRLGDVENFPFIDPPDRRAVRDGVALLQELGAFDDTAAITDVGRRVAQLPVDPRLARMILQANDEGCVREVLVIAAALSIPDPRERPPEREEAARASHARFADEHSDFIAFLNLWNHLRTQRRELSGNQFRRMCREEFLHYLRIREWQDLVGQLRTIARGLGIVENDEPADSGRVHDALVAGLLSHIGLREGESREFLGARNTRFVIAPGSALSKKPPRWVVVAELVETSRLFGRVAARVEPEHIERLAGDLVARSYSEPRWDARRGAVMADERVTLYGVPLVARRRVGYASVEPDVARELFIRHALVEGDWDTRHHFFRDNQALLAELAEIEERARRRDLIVGDDELFDFYDKRIPADVVSSRHFDAWWKKQRHKTPSLLTLTRDDALRARRRRRREPAGVAGRRPFAAASATGSNRAPTTTASPCTYPSTCWRAWAVRSSVGRCPHCARNSSRRSSARCPRTCAATSFPLRIPPGRCWPSSSPVRSRCSKGCSANCTAAPACSSRSTRSTSTSCRRTCASPSRSRTPPARSWRAARIWLRCKRSWPPRCAPPWPRPSPASSNATGCTRWPDDLDELPQSVERTSGQHTVRGYPAFVDRGNAVSIRVFASAVEQAAAMRLGVRRLVRLATPSPTKAVERTLATKARLVLGTSPDGSIAALLDDCADAAVDTLVPALPWTRTDFDAVLAEVRAELVPRVADIAQRVERVLAAAHEVRRALPAKPPASQAEAVDDIRAQFDRLLPAGFVARAGRDRLPDLARYLTAVARRLELLPRDVDTDRARMQRVRAVTEVYEKLVAALPASRAAADDIVAIGWQLEEFRVSLWAQQLGTPRPVSEQRIYRAIDAVTP